ncbi:hypothetical protein NKG05_10850 [Oerskovia sp. M15]
MTIADSSLFDAVETTMLCEGDKPATFDEARGRVRTWWTSDLDKMEFLLDVQAAHRRVKPLPTIRMEGTPVSSRWLGVRTGSRKAAALVGPDDGRPRWKRSTRPYREVASRTARHDLP